MLEALNMARRPTVEWPLTDRLTMLLAGTDNIRDVIAFPKVQAASCLMSNAPDVVEEKQLEELHIKTVSKKVKNKIIKEILDWGLYITAVLLALIVLFLGRITVVEGTSMVPTLRITMC